MTQHIKVAKKDQLLEGKGISVQANGKTIALFKIGENFYAIDDACTHVGGNLSEGDIIGNVVTCPWHGATFDVTNGAVLGGPADAAVGSYKVKTEGNDILIEIA